MTHVDPTRIAIVHDSLIEFGGAERVAQALCDLYPSADLYTSVGDKGLEQRFFSKTNVYHIPIPQRFFARHPSLFQLLSPILWGSLNLEKYDVVIANSAHLMANLVRVRNPICIQYIQSLPKNIFGLEPPTPLQRTVPYAYFVRRVYNGAVRASSFVLTNSHHMQRTLKTSCAIQADCMYPPVSLPTRVLKKKTGTYYLIVSRLDRSKSIELAIHACNMLREKLVIIGISNEAAYDRYLRRIAGPTIVFDGFQTDQEIQRRFQGAKAFLFTPRNEDFGIAPVEAMGAGVPVIAYRGGGARETVTEGKTGIFFPDHTAESLARTMTHLDGVRFDYEHMRRYVQRFSRAQFNMRMRMYVERAAQSVQRRRTASVRYNES